uniref:Rx N-terminal domain-containing protein n=1 Tax=Fagus sylvatica TaxID=28930 RepID=A0A2N9F111_FAGSY
MQGNTLVLPGLFLAEGAQHSHGALLLVFLYFQRDWIALGCWNDEFEKIKNTVSTIRAVLLDAAEQQSHNHQVRDWLEKLKDAVYDADDLLGEFSTEAMREARRKIKAMRKKLDAIAEDRKKFHLKEYHAETNAVSRKREPTHSFVREEEVIGREEDKKAIISLLLESNVEENVSVIPIVGIGGLGKTTLAQYVFNDKDVKKYFDLKMWVCVSDSTLS